MATLSSTNVEEDVQTHPTIKDTLNIPPKSDEEDSEIFLELDDYSPKGKQSIIRKSIQKSKGKKKYNNISNELRLRLIDLVEKQKLKIKHAAKKLNINYSSAKSICQIYKREGRTNKKVFKKNFDDDDSTPEREECSLSLGSSKEESASSSSKQTVPKTNKILIPFTEPSKIENISKMIELTPKIIKPEDIQTTTLKIPTLPSAFLVENSTNLNPVQSFISAKNQTKPDLISPNKLLLNKPFQPSIIPTPLILNSNSNILQYSQPQNAIMIQQPSSYSPFQTISYNNSGYIRQVTNPQNSFSDSLNLYQSSQTQNTIGETTTQAQNLMPQQASVIVLGNNYGQQQMGSPYFMTNNPNFVTGQQMGGYQILQPVICVMPQQASALMGYQQNGGQDQNVVLQSQQLGQQSNFGINQMYQNYGYGKSIPNFQYIMMKNTEEQKK